MRDAVAIVSMSCRYPDAPDPGRLWETVMARRRAFRPMPRGRLDLDGYRGGGPDSTYLEYAAVLDGWSFDRARFRVPGGTFRVTDQSHWLALDTAAEALELAGFTDRPDAERERAGVVLGNSLTGEFSRASLMRFRWPYVKGVLHDGLRAEGWEGAALDRLLSRLEAAYKLPFPAPTEDSLVGGLSNAIAGRICNHFDLRGGGFTVDGACASSLLAVTTACMALVNGDLDFVLAGGVDLSLDPFETVGFARVGALGVSEMRVFDADPTGFLPGEGCGIVALMRADDAIASGRSPLALIRGWGISSDGQGGLIRPEPAGQTLALRRAYRRAGFGPETVTLFEGHGTGTQTGDETELSALIAVQDGRRRMPPAALGSIKANIGHTKAAAGVAGLIKATLALQRQVVPPTTGCEEPHELLCGDQVPIRVTGEAAPWPDAPLRAAVSAMGFGGINTHVVLEASAPRRSPRLTAAERRTARPPLDHEVVLLAADSADELLATLRRIAVRAESMSHAELTDLAGSLAAHARRGMTHRAALIARRPGHLAQRAQQAIGLVTDPAARRDGVLSVLPGVFVGYGRPGRVGLLFPGQGVVPDAGGALGVVCPDGLEGLPTPPPVGTDPAATEVAQPEILRACVAGLRWLDRLGVRAAAAVGHSVGELAALHWAGALDASQAVELAGVRGRIMSERGAPSTGMVSVAAPLDQVRDLVAGTGLVVAADNGAAVVIAGGLPELEETIGRARALGLTAQRLRVSHAFHSPAVADAAEPFARYLARVGFGPLTGRVYSTVTGRLLTRGDDLCRLLVEQVTRPVLFRAAVESLAAECDLLVEVGPGRMLTTLVRSISTLPVAALDCGSMSAEGICATAGALFAADALSDPQALFAERFHRPFDLWRDPRFLENPCDRATAHAALSQAVLPAGPPPESGPRDDVRQVVYQAIAEALELPAKEISDGDWLLSDLHLSSLRATQIAAEVIATCGRAVPADPLPLAELSVGDLIAAVEVLERAVEASQPAPPGVAEWHRVLVTEPVPLGLPEEAVDHTWQIFGGGPMRAGMETALTGSSGTPAVVVFLPEDPRESDISELLRETRRAVAEGITLTVVESGDAASGFLATIAQEHPDLTIRWIQALTPPAPDTLTRVLQAPHTGHTEVIIDSAGETFAPGYRPIPPAPDATPPLRPGDVLLVTGGGKGLGALTALTAAELWGVRPVLLGRARPETDEELRASLADLDRSGTPYHYLSADVTDPADVRHAIAKVGAEWGPIRGVIHAAGVNRPQRFSDLGTAAYAEHSGPKHAGLRNVLEALDREALRLLVTFGSVIGRFGLPGEAHYALANGRMRELARVLAGELPGCRVCNVDWTVWSDVGMGERLDVLETLTRSGVAPLPPDAGKRLLRHIAEMPAPPPSVVVAGRFPQLAAPADESRHGDHGDAQRLRAHTPHVELITETRLTATDPRLNDHRVDGLSLLPAVCALEAMAQVAARLTGRGIHGIEDGQFERPVIIPDEGSRVIRVCALVREDGDIDVVLRSDETDFAVDHFRGRATLTPMSAPKTPERPPAGPGPSGSGERLYGRLFFHGPYYRRLRTYEHLEATECTALLAPTPLTPPPATPTPAVPSEVISSMVPSVREGEAESVFGDVGRNDASLHVLQGCVPHRRLLPTGCDRFAVHGREPSGGELRLRAVERSHEGSDYTYDVVLCDAVGRPVVSWTGLRLRDTGPLPHFAEWPAVLLRPYLQRVVPDLLIGTSLRLDGAEARPEGWGAMDGLTIVAPVGSRSACGWVRAAEAGGREEFLSKPPWAEALRSLISITGEAEREAVMRLQGIRRCRRELGRPEVGQLTVQGAYEGGWVKLRAHDDEIVTTVVSIEGETDPVALAIMIAREP